MNPRLILAPILAVMEWREGGGGEPAFRARRCKGKAVYEHDGIDIACAPGESVCTPLGGDPARVIICYEGDTYRGRASLSWASCSPRSR